MKKLVVILFILSMSCLVGCQNKYQVQADKLEEILNDSKFKTDEFGNLILYDFETSTVDIEGNRVDLVVDEKYLVKDVREYQTLHKGYLAYHTLLVLENLSGERFFHKYLKYDFDNNIFQEDLEDVFVKGRTYTVIPFVTGDVLHYLGNNEFELVENKPDLTII